MQQEKSRCTRNFKRKKGFQGVIKRHGQHRGPMGHGLRIIEDQVQWDLHQHQEEYLKEKNYQDIWEELTVTIQNLDVVKVDMDKNVILVKGSVPGAKGVPS